MHKFKIQMQKREMDVMESTDWRSRVFVPAEDNLLSLVVWIVVAAQKKVRAVMLRSAGEVICHCLPSRTTRASSYTVFISLALSPSLSVSVSVLAFVYSSLNQNPTSTFCWLSATLAKCSFLFVSLSVLQYLFNRIAMFLS